MVVYNTTFVCEDAMLQNLLVWLNGEFIPRMTESAIASAPQLARVLPHDNQDENAVSLSLQFRFDGIDSLQTWLEVSYYPMIEKMSRRYANAVLCFSTVLELLPISNQN